MRRRRDSVSETPSRISPIGPGRVADDRNEDGTSELADTAGRVARDAPRSARARGAAAPLADARGGLPARMGYHPVPRRPPTPPPVRRRPSPPRGSPDTHDLTPPADPANADLG